MKVPSCAGTVTPAGDSVSNTSGPSVIVNSNATVLFTGIAVHVGARVAALAQPGEVLVTSTVTQLVLGSEIHFAARGAHTLKGIAEQWQLFAVVA